MKSERWAEWLTPVTGGMAIALLIVATVVRPAKADGNTSCGQCMSYWDYKVNKDKLCDHLTQYKKLECKYKKISEECGDTPEDDSKPCPGPDSPDTLADCGSEECNYYAGSGVEELNVCDWNCWSRRCESGGVEYTCLDRQKPCELGDPTYKCSECRCNPTP
jgi:hypothetical protein